MEGQPQSQQAPTQSEARHPMDAFMRTAMDSLKGMVDVNTILGVPVQTQDGNVIIPVSRVSFGFVAGGSEFETDPARPERKAFPFGGGSGAGVSLSPVAFLVVSRGEVRLLPVSDRALYDRVLDLVPRVIQAIQNRAGRDGAGSPGQPSQAPAGAIPGESPGSARPQDGSGMHERSGRRGGRSLTLRFE